MSVAFLEGAEYEAAMKNSVMPIATELQVAKQRITVLEQLVEERLQMIRQRNTQIGALQTRVAAMQDTINELNRRLAHEPAGG